MFMLLLYVYSKTKKNYRKTDKSTNVNWQLLAFAVRAGFFLIKV